jgi:hypothetical protein
VALENGADCGAVVILSKVDPDAVKSVSLAFKEAARR